MREGVEGRKKIRPKKEREEEKISVKDFMATLEKDNEEEEEKAKPKKKAAVKKPATKKKATSKKKADEEAGGEAE